LLVALSCAWGITPAFGILFARRLGLGAPGGWLAMALEMIAASTLVWWNIARLGWLQSARRAHKAGRRPHTAQSPALAQA
jgi:Na+-driven multidrug efflux pump